jgi:hypothetical protein
MGVVSIYQRPGTKFSIPSTRPDERLRTAPSPAGALCLITVLSDVKGHADCTILAPAMADAAAV